MSENKPVIYVSKDKHTIYVAVTFDELAKEVERLRAENATLREALKCISIGMLYPKEFAFATLNDGKLPEPPMRRRNEPHCFKH